MKGFNLPVGYTTYKVKLTKNKPLCDGEKVQGYCHYDVRRIVARNNPQRDVLRAVLWHEFIHAVFHELGAHESRDNEVFVEGIAQAIMRVRLEQPWL